MTKPRTMDNSGQLFNYVMDECRLVYDAQLAKRLETSKSVISNIRTGKCLIGDSLLLRICDEVNISVKNARRLIAEKNSSQ